MAAGRARKRWRFRYEAGRVIMGDNTHINSSSFGASSVAKDMLGYNPWNSTEDPMDKVVAKQGLNVVDIDLLPPLCEARA